MPYSAEFTSDRGMPTANFPTNDVLPPGLKLLPTKGRISGTPTEPGIHKFSVLLDNGMFPDASRKEFTQEQDRDRGHKGQIGYIAGEAGILTVRVRPVTPGIEIDGKCRQKKDGEQSGEPCDYIGRTHATYERTSRPGHGVSA